MNLLKQIFDCFTTTRGVHKHQMMGPLIASLSTQTVSVLGYVRSLSLDISEPLMTAYQWIMNLINKSTVESAGI